MIINMSSNVAAWRLLSRLSLSVLLCCFANLANAVPPVTTSGNQVLFGGQATSLAGNSFFWSNNNYGGERYYNRATVSWLKRDWKTGIVRAAMGVEDPGGYIDDQTRNRNRTIALVEAAIAEDIYVIIDWHSHRAEDNEQAAVTFFRDMARRYKGVNNVIFEIYNEPVNTSWSRIKSYASNVIKAIRDQGADNLIIVGTPFYSQRVDEASRSKIEGYSNIAYTLHFYAGTHGEGLRNQARTALRNGIPLFVTEWGTVNANGDGGVAEAETNRWMSFLRDNNISHLNWAVNDKREGASIIKPGTSTQGNWPADALTNSGRFVRDIVRSWTGIPITNTPGNPTPTGPTEPRNGKKIVMAPIVSLLL